MPSAEPRPSSFDAVEWSRQVKEQISSLPRKNWTVQESREAAARLGLLFVLAPQHPVPTAAPTTPR